MSKIPKLKGAPDSKGMIKEFTGQLALFNHVPPFCYAKGSYFFIGPCLFDYLIFNGKTRRNSSR